MFRITGDTLQHITELQTQVTTNGRHRREGGGQVEKGRTHREAYEYKPKEETTHGAEEQQELTDFGLDVERHPISAQFV